MSKRIYIYLSIAIFAAIIIIAGGYYFYKNPTDNQFFQTGTGLSNGEECDSEECMVETSNIIDGVFQKTENGLLYFKPKDKEETRSVKMSEDIVFTEVTLSDTFENIGERNINLTDFNNGDQVSVNVRYNDFIKEEIAVKASCIIVEGAISASDNKEIIDGVFQKTENGLLYFKPKDKEETRSVKMSEDIVFTEVTLSDTFENIGERNINLTDFNNGDQVSVFIGLNELNEDIVSKLIRIIAPAP